MDESFYCAELCEQFKLFEADYNAYGNGGHEDVTSSSEEESENLDGSSDNESTQESCQENEREISMRKEDKTEMELVESFGCSCSLGPENSSCSALFTKEAVAATRLNCLEMTTEALDMLVLAHFDAHRRCGSVGEQTCRIAMNYYYHGKEVCKYTYRFVHAMGPKRFKNLLIMQNMA